MNFAGQTVVITGAASGIGLEIWRHLHSAGANCVAIDLKRDALECAAADCGIEDSLMLSADVTQLQDLEASVRHIEKRFGHIHGLVHSAGIGIEKSFMETTEFEWRQIMDVDLTGTFFCCQTFAKHMATRGYGRIVNLASTAGLRGGTGRAAYGAAKGGVITLTKVMAVELAEFGITVNALAPGAIETALVKRMHSDETRRVYKNAIPVNRYGAPEEVAVAALFLASKEAGYITGQVLGVDGGFLAAGILNRGSA